MGDIADMMIDGTLDSETGEYIGDSVGYPRTLSKSLPWEKDHIHSPRNQKKGIHKFLFKSFKGYKYSDMPKYVDPFLKSINLDSRTDKVQAVQEHWQEFRHYILNLKRK